MSKVRVSAVVNGEPVEFLGGTRQSLLDALRDELGLTGSKEGCGSLMQPQRATTRRADRADAPQA